MRINYEKKHLWRGRQPHGVGAMTNAIKAGFAAAVFTTFFVILLWPGWAEEWKGLLLLIPGAPLSVWAANTIMHFAGDN
jgi:hypothetical protein